MFEVFGKFPRRFAYQWSDNVKLHKGANTIWVKNYEYFY